MTQLNMKAWLSDNGISYRRLASQMDQSAASICLKVNRKTKWQADDLVWLHEHYGLSADFVLGLSDSPYHGRGEVVEV